MKKIYAILMSAILVAGTFTSCDDKDTEGLTGITYYPIITLDGDATLYLDKGSNYVEPGFTAILNGEDISDDVAINSNFTQGESGVFTITYTATNADGFQKTVSRTIIVTDPNDPVEGFYTVDKTQSARVYNGTTAGFKGNFSIMIFNKGDYYEIDDLLGGWYCQGAGYGSSYAMQAHLSIAEDGTIELIDSYLPGWGDSATGFSDGKFDAATKTISYTVVYVSGMTFNVTMVKD